MLAELVDAVVGVDTHRDTHEWRKRSCRDGLPPGRSSPVPPSR
jgi:hypothetical protein